MLFEVIVLYVFLVLVGRRVEVTKIVQLFARLGTFVDHLASALGVPLLNHVLFINVVLELLELMLLIFLTRFESLHPLVKLLFLDFHLVLKLLLLLGQVL